MRLLLNAIFGWHYIEYRDSATSFVGRVKRLPNGKLRLVTFIGVYDANLKHDGTFEGSFGRWTPLTWSQEGVSHGDYKGY